MDLVLGIDLGTTNSLAAKLDAKGMPVVIPNAEGLTATPSVIAFASGEILVGSDALDVRGMPGIPVVEAFKRSMGDPSFGFRAGGVTYSPTELSTIVLKKLKDDAEAAEGRPVRQAVITVPAYFRDAERRATIEAGEGAGLDVFQVINEPTAAAVAYGVRERRGSRKSAGGRFILVYDLGGGTFDVTLLSLSSDEITVVCSDGDYGLGGKDWDERIIEFAAGAFQQEFGVDPLEDQHALTELVAEAERAKIALSALASTAVRVNAHGHTGRYELTRMLFQSATEALVRRTISLMEAALDEAGRSKTDVSDVLLVGGSTRMPAIQAAIEDVIGRSPRIGLNVDQVVAMGAAIIASDHASRKAPAVYLPSLIRTVDVVSHSMGMIAENERGDAYVNSIILKKNTKLPCEAFDRFDLQTRSDGESHMEVFVTQGDSDSPNAVSYVRKYVIHDIPRQPSGSTEVNVAYGYDESGTIQVDATALGRGLRVTEEALPDDVPERFMGQPIREMATGTNPVTVVLAIDVSGSMSGSPIEDARAAAHGFVANIDLSTSSVGFAVFSDETLVRCAPTHDGGTVANAIDGMRVCETGVGNAAIPFKACLESMADSSGARFIVVLTDGEWFDDGAGIDEARACHDEGVGIITIGFGDADEDFLQAIASADEASVFTSQDTLVEDFSSIARVLASTGGKGMLRAR